MQETPRCRLGSFGKTPSPPRPEFKSRPAARCGARSQLSPRLKQLLLATNTHCRSYLSRNRGQGCLGCCRSRCSCRRRSRVTCSLPRRYACLPSRFPKLAPGAPRSRLRRAHACAALATAHRQLTQRTGSSAAPSSSCPALVPSHAAPAAAGLLVPASAPGCPTKAQLTPLFFFPLPPSLCLL